jgi:hypothetical protein
MLILLNLADVEGRESAGGGVARAMRRSSLNASSSYAYPLLILLMHILLKCMLIVKTGLSPRSRPSPREDVDWIR